MKRLLIGVKTPPLSQVPTGAIRIGPMLAIPRLLAAKGVALQPILAAMKLPPTLFDDPDVAIPLAVAGELARRCADAAKDPNSGLHVGQLAGASSLGVSGFVVQHSPDVRTALRNLERHIALHDSAGIVTIAIEGEVASLLYEL
jgi:hypothetical protein